LKYWITKYALTRGIIEVDDAEEELSYRHRYGAKLRDDTLTIPHPGGIPDKTTYYGADGEWHRTKESAIAKAEEMRIKAIEKHRRSLERLEKMSFAEPKK
jgi:hypothetical protein